jgi:hypothetical protein
MGIVEDLLEHAGLYIGISHDIGHEGQAAARIFVDPLPGRSGVSLEYETFNAGNANRIRGHHERAIVARTHTGGAILVTGHDHADSIAVLRETDPGVFELGDEGSPFPMKITIEMAEPGHLVHCWWYGRPGGTAEQHDRTELRLQRP